MEKIVDLIMTNLFLMAEKLCSRYSFITKESAAPQKVAQPIRFSYENKPVRPKVEIVEGDLFISDNL